MPIVGDRPEISVKSVIFATDFSSCSQNAGSYARVLANYFSATLLVAHAFLLSRPAKEVELAGSAPSRQRTDLQARLAQIANALGSGTVKTVPALLEGNPHEAIPTLAEEYAPSVIVLGTHGAGPVEHELIGSVAEKILRSTEWPSLTVGPKTPPITAESLPFQRILYATDFTPAAANAAAFALALAESAGGSIDTLNVIPDDAAGDSDRLTELKKHYIQAIDELVPPHARDFCNPHTYVETGSAHDRIMEHIQKHTIDLLVLGIRKTSHLGLEMRTSGAFRLIADAACPVLTITG